MAARRARRRRQSRQPQRRRQLRAAHRGRRARSTSSGLSRAKPRNAASSTSRVVYRYHGGGMKKLFVALVIALTTASVAGGAGRALEIYFIDVEGGQSTLIVTSSGQSLLVDTGYPERDGRDPDRIIAAMRDAHVSRIDYLLVTHMHEDHNGGSAELSRRVPIVAFIDYGPP